jgi:hypothetical protein
MSIALRYSVDIHDFGAPSRPCTKRGLTLSQAWRIVRRQARRGFRLYGGGLDFGNWGARGGAFPTRYRSAVIGLDSIAARKKRPKPAA